MKPYNNGYELCFEPKCNLNKLESVPEILRNYCFGTKIINFHPESFFNSYFNERNASMTYRTVDGDYKNYHGKRSNQFWCLPYGYTQKEAHNLPCRHGSYEKDLDEVFERAAQIDNYCLVLSQGCGIAAEIYASGHPLMQRYPCLGKDLRTGQACGGMRLCIIDARLRISRCYRYFEPRRWRRLSATGW